MITNEAGTRRSTETMEVEEDQEIKSCHQSSTWFEMELPLGISASSSETEPPFQLEKAVCSHGLFMMAPNHWNPLTKTLTRPLHHQHPSSSSSLIVSISHSQNCSTSLTVRVQSTHSLSHHQQQALLAQVSRMLRLSETEENAVREFRRSIMHLDHQYNKSSFGGRVFRSPTLFEDMVKCILLCNCQWSRTLSMAQALCDLQFELQNGPNAAVAVSGNPKAEADCFIPKTPVVKETERKGGKSSGVSTKGVAVKKKLELEVDGDLQMDHVLASNSDTTALPADIDGNSCHGEAAKEPSSDDSLPNGTEYFKHTGNFPSPNELARLEEFYLAKRCKLGYRAGHIIKLARAIVEGKIQLGQLEELSKDARLSSYEQLEDQLKQIKGFGPFTRANVLMCMGYYHVIPADTETIRHLKQVHSRSSTPRTVQRDLEEIYGKYEPYQFLAYWSEIWDFYEKRFGKMSEMQSSDYKRITAANMKSTVKRASK